MAFACQVCLSQSNHNTRGRTAASSYNNHQFNVYGFIVYGGYVKNTTRVNASFGELQLYLSHLGVKKYNLIYENKLLDYPKGDKSNGEPDLQKIDSLADEAMQEPDVPVSLDLEGWKRFDTVNTPKRMIAAIKAFKKTNKISKVGLYATVPQNTHAYADGINKYDKYNKAYAGVAAMVDYFSPSLYAYTSTDSEWVKSAIYNIEACKKYGYPDKKILPYITPVVIVNGVRVQISYDEMTLRLNTLYQLGADGCLIWTSSLQRDSDGNKIYIDENTGWLKAVKDFIAAHP